MSDTSSSLHDDGLPADESRRPAPRTGRHRTAALIVGGALLFAGGAGTGAVVGTALSPAAAQTSQTGPGGAGGGMGQPPGGQLPGGTTSGQGGSTSGGTTSGQTGTQGRAPSAAPSTAPSTSTS